ncbi:YgdB family protein [Serratia sp. UGAL515B_01]|nr:YgdB family protein [Serratia sp. UGAL515B_01]WON78959.1 YgdB family protein [Serratia sp. UGAL515B_01]
MNRRKQQGGSTLVVVMMLLVVGLMMLTAQHRQLDSALLLAADQQRYLRAYNQAASALSWGLAQSWPRTSLQTRHWHCQEWQDEALLACVKRLGLGGVVMVRGAGQIPGAEPLWLYQLATEFGGEGGINLKAQKGGWLDFCPAKRESDCVE